MFATGVLATDLEDAQNQSSEIQQQITGGARYPITSTYEPSRVSPISGRVEKHLAIDIGAPGGSGVYALKAVTVEYAGWSTGNHIHFEVIINGVKVDPEPYYI